MLTYILLDFSIPEYIISNRIVKIVLSITFGIPGTYPRSISIFTFKLATCTVLIRICVEEEPEGDLIDLAKRPEEDLIDLKQNLGRPKGRQPVGILQRVKKIGYQLNQKQGEPSEQTSDTD